MPAATISLSQDKYCSVAATVRGVAEIVNDLEIIDAERTQFR